VIKLRRTLLVLLALSCITLYFNGMAANPPATATTLEQDSGTNVTQMNLTFALSPTYGSAQTVKFTAPRNGWTLQSVRILGSDGWNSTDTQLPTPLPFAIEIRNADLRLLYHFSDTQLPYFTISKGIRMASIEVPDIQLSGDFFVCFYGYRSIAIAAELQNTTGNSYYFDKLTGELYEGTFPSANNQTRPLNWLIRVTGQ
jgi:hypothetical protein